MDRLPITAARAGIITTGLIIAAWAGRPAMDTWLAAWGMQ